MASCDTIFIASQHAASMVSTAYPRGRVGEERNVRVRRQYRRAKHAASLSLTTDWPVKSKRGQVPPKRKWDISDGNRLSAPPALSVSQRPRPFHSFTTVLSIHQLHSHRYPSILCHIPQTLRRLPRTYQQDGVCDASEPLQSAGISVNNKPPHCNIAEDIWWRPT